MSESKKTSISKLLFELDNTTLVFLPSANIQVGDHGDKSKSNPLAGHRVAQVTVEPEAGTNIKATTAFFLVQHEISDLITRIVCAHHLRPLPNPVAFEGSTYLIVANRKPWAYGKSLDFRWGDEHALPCEDKWTFTFSVKSGSQASVTDQPSSANQERRKSSL
ncbi:hypothetical protein SCHPADRAFT_350024 [Schizopora paradoxa]|uniref:Uncharacterized protein n=1 Tax=Schizopora paradoxa TaxID=27342 RepID=A0A0H2RWB3_9AGAM|nr:hypothetical protein SCHPADRAFT_350024 [Schizopora paradoxa]